MKLHHTATLGVSPQVAWTFLTDVPRAARCVPGAGPVEWIDDDRYRGTLRVRVGPVSLSMQGDVVVVSQDQDSLTASMRIEASDRSIGGDVQADLEMRLESVEAPGGPSTRLTIVTDARVLGRIGEFGQPMIKRKADQIIEQFVTNVEQRIAADGGTRG